MQDQRIIHLSFIKVEHSEERRLNHLEQLHNEVGHSVFRIDDAQLYTEVFFKQNVATCIGRTYCRPQLILRGRHISVGQARLDSNSTHQSNQSVAIVG
jgi:hypothetical protein